MPTSRASGASVVAALVRALMPTTLPTMPVTVGPMPDDAPDARVCVLDTVSPSDGRDMDGVPYSRPGVQVRFRHNVYETAMANARAVWARVQTLRGVRVTVPGTGAGGADETVVIEAVMAATEPLYMGMEEREARQLAALNLTFSYRP